MSGCPKPGFADRLHFDEYILQFVSIRVDDVASQYALHFILNVGRESARAERGWAIRLPAGRSARRAIQPVTRVCGWWSIFGARHSATGGRRVRRRPIFGRSLKELAAGHGNAQSQE